MVMKLNPTKSELILSDYALKLHKLEIRESNETNKIKKRLLQLKIKEKKEAVKLMMIMINTDTINFDEGDFDDLQY